MVQRLRVIFDVRENSVTLGDRVVLPAGRYEGVVQLGAEASTSPSAEIERAMLEIDPDLAAALGAPFAGSTASIAINVTEAIKTGGVSVAEYLRGPASKTRH